MTGAECLLQTLVENGIDVCFMNPGTSEMHFVAALDRVPGMRGVLCLYEGVCSGAADGYGRMMGRPASALLHLGPGLGNSLSNFHNARKARTPIVGIVGEHSTSHLKYDAPLTSDIAAFARTVSTEVRTVASPETIGLSASETIAAAVTLPGQVAMLIVPADYSWLESGASGARVEHPRRRPPTRERLQAAGKLADMGETTAFVVGGTAMNPRALDAIARITAATGARFFADRTAPRLASGRGRYQVPKVPYFPEDARAALAGLTHMVLVEGQTPVSFFGYPNTPNTPVPDDCIISTLASREQDGTAALEALAALCAGRERPAAQAIPDMSIDPAAPLTVEIIGKTLVDTLPENAIVSDEMISASASVLTWLAHAAPHDQLTITGGAIGQGLPVAVGAAVACPDRKVIALEADGSAMYSIQSLWTMARENLDVTVVIFANRRYRILDIEMRRTGAKGVGKSANDMLDLGRPDLDFVSLAEGMGVQATRARTAGEFDEQFRSAVAQKGPRLIEAVL